MKKQIVSMKRGAQKGFTLIELMIVVAIIAVLAAFALPAYQDYMARTRVAEGLVVAAGAKSGISEYYATKGSWPATNTEAGIASATKITGRGVTSVGVSGAGLITITYNSKLGTEGSTKTVILTPSFASGDGSIKWTCFSAAATMPLKLLPAECRTAG